MIIFRAYPKAKIYPGIHNFSPRLLFLNSCSACPFSSVASLSKKTFEDGAKKRTSISRLLKVTRTQSGRISAGLAFLVISSGVTLSVPYWLGLLIDQATDTGGSTASGLLKSPFIEKLINSEFLSKFTNLFNFAGVEVSGKSTNMLMIIFLILSTGAFCNAMRVYMFKSAGINIGNRLRNTVFQSIIHNRTYSQYYALSAKTGDLSSRLNADVNIMAECSSQVISDVFRSLSQLGLGLGMMFYTSSSLTLITCMSIPPMLLMGKLQGNLLQETSKKSTEQLGSVVAFSSERFYNLKEVHASGQNAQECNRFFKLNGQLASYGMNEAKARSIFFGLTGFVGNIILIGVISYGGNLVQNGIITIGQLGSYLMYSGYVGVSISRMSSAYAELMKGLASSDRVWQIISLKEFEKEALQIPIEKYSHEFIQKYMRPNPDNITDCLVKFDNVTFTYPTLIPGSTPEIIRDINFCLKEGEILAITGLSGCGKTTIMSLLLKLFEPSLGQIYWNGYDVSKLDAIFTRNYLMSSVLQENVLFNGTIRDNIIFDQEFTSFDEMRFREVCEVAQVNKFIGTMDIQVGERGANLSGGQRQRVLIARALYKMCPLLLFDEATSALDANTEKALFNSLKSFRKENPVSIITIAHRKATLETADRIIILGKKNKSDISSTILASGSFDELAASTVDNKLVDDIITKLVASDANSQETIN